MHNQSDRSYCARTYKSEDNGSQTLMVDELLETVVLSVMYKRLRRSKVSNVVVCQR